MDNKITKFEITNLWNKYDVVWDNINPDVNILVGMNGGGKSTMLKVICDCVKIHSKSVLKKYPFSGCRVTMQDKGSYTCGGDFGITESNEYVDIEYINIFEPNIGKLRRGESILDHQLDRLFYQRDAGVDNFTNFRLKASFGENREQVTNRIQMFFDLVNSMFEKSDKKIEIADNNVDIQFRDSMGNVIGIKLLSSGEKQLLILMLKVFLTEDNDCIILFDEPEISLHLEWQHKFIDTICKLNPNMQIFISTHSPSIFGDGWNDKLFFMEDFIVAKNAVR